MNLRRYLIVSLVLIMLITLSAIFVVHRKVWGVRDALEQLVSSGTHGQYQLGIKDYSVNLNPFHIKFDSLTIFKRDSAKADVKSVYIQHFVLATGSLVNFMLSGQLEIDTLEISEPIIELTPTGTHKSKGSHFSQQVVKLYPAVLAILEHFNVVHLAVTRASLNIHQKNKTDLQLKLIDLMLENWDVKDLRDDRQLRLTIGQHHIKLSKGEFNFSAIEYNFRARELRFSDYTFTSVDSVSHNRINASGEYIAFKHLNYDELFHHQRLVYERIIFQHPVIRARLHQHANTNKKQNTQQLITDFVANTFGEFSLDSATVANAAITLTMLSGYDSMVIEIPDATINTNRIRILPNQPIHIGDIDIHMKQSQIQLTNRSSISFDEFLLNLDKTLSVKNLLVYKDSNKQKIAAIPFVEFTPIDLMRIIEEKRLELAGIKMYDAQFWIKTAKTNSDKTSDISTPFSEINIQQLDLQNLSLNYQGHSEQFFANGVSIHVNKISSNPAGIEFSLQKFIVKQTKAEIPTKRVRFQGTDILLNGASISAKHLSFTKNNLSLLVNDFVALHDNMIKDPRRIDHLKWKSVRLNNLEISGSPDLTPQNKRSGLGLPFATKKIEVSKILLSLNRGDTTLRGSINDLLIQNVTHSADQPIAFSELSATSKDLQLKTGLMNAEITKLAVRWPGHVEANDLKYYSGSKEFTLGNLEVKDVANDAGKWLSSSIAFRNIRLSQEGISVNLDSVHVDSLLWDNRKPKVSLVEVYRPEIKLTKKENQKSNLHDQKTGVSVSDLVPDEFVVHPGKLELGNGNTVHFGTVRSNFRKKYITIQTLDYQAPKNIINVSNLVVNSNEVVVDTISILPNELWFSQNNLEVGKVYMKLSHVKIPNQVFDSLLFFRRFYPTTLDISNFDLRVTKDKRLPDPPEIEKPWSLSSMINNLVSLPVPLPIQSVEVKDGNIRIEETSDKTGQTGKLELNDIHVKLDLTETNNFVGVTLDAGGKLYNQGRLQLNYWTLHPDTFKLQFRLRDFDLRLLNEMVSPTLSVEIKSGKLNRYFAEMIATNDRAEGAAGITYRDLHIDINKPGESKRNSVLSVISDDIILTNSKKNWVISEFEVERVKHKSVFAYWVKLSSKGAVDVIVNGR